MGKQRGPIRGADGHRSLGCPSSQIGRGGAPSVPHNINRCCNWATDSPMPGQRCGSPATSVRLVGQFLSIDQHSGRRCVGGEARPEESRMSPRGAGSGTTGCGCPRRRQPTPSHAEPSVPPSAQPAPRPSAAGRPDDGQPQRERWFMRRAAPACGARAGCPDPADRGPDRGNDEHSEYAATSTYPASATRAAPAAK